MVSRGSVDTALSTPQDKAVSWGVDVSVMGTLDCMSIPLDSFVLRTLDRESTPLDTRS